MVHKTSQASPSGSFRYFLATDQRVRLTVQHYLTNCIVCTGGATRTCRNGLSRIISATQCVPERQPRKNKKRRLWRVAACGEVNPGSAGTGLGSGEAPHSSGVEQMRRRQFFFAALPLARLTFFFLFDSALACFLLARTRSRECEATITTMAPIELARHSGHLARVCAPGSLSTTLFSPTWISLDQACTN